MYVYMYACEVEISRDIDRDKQTDKQTGQTDR